MRYRRTSPGAIKINLTEGRKVAFETSIFPSSDTSARDVGHLSPKSKHEGKSPSDSRLRDNGGDIVGRICTVTPSETALLTCNGAPSLRVSSREVKGFLSSFGTHLLELFLASPHCKSTCLERQVLNGRKL